MILILGSEGQLAQSFKNLLSDRNAALTLKNVSPNDFLGSDFLEFKVLGRNEIDFINPDATIKKIAEYEPKWIINTAAYTMVDKAESEKELCFQINALTPIRIAHWCKEEHVNLIHYSTDYVFNGAGDVPWVETDKTDPINYYGQTKRASEEGIIQSECAHLIFRISWVYNYIGTNFVKTMLRLGAEREELKIVSDQVGYPSYAPDIAKATLECMLNFIDKKSAPSELLHLSSSDHTTWYQFAQTIFSKARTLGIPLKVKNVVPITTAEYPAPAKRILNSRLNSDKIKELYNITLPNWEKSLENCLTKLITHNS
jgi:dTDP-4-dehydrorhamnose reductase